MNYEDVKASPLTRIGAALVDIMIAALLYVLVAGLIVSPIVSNMKSYTENYEIYSTGLISTGLYKENEQHNVEILIANYSDDTIETNTKINTYDQALINFYQPYGAAKLEEYETAKKGETKVYSYNSETMEFSIVDDVSMSDAYSFFTSEYTKAVNYYLSQNSEVNASYQVLRKLTTTADVLGIVFVLLIVYLLFPMIFKEGQTLGKKMFSLQVVNSKGELRDLKKYQILLRQACFIVVELGLSIFTFGIPLLASTIVMCVTKKHCSIHDYASFTYVIDGVKVKNFGVYNEPSKNANVVQETIIESESENK